MADFELDYSRQLQAGVERIILDHSPDSLGVRIYAEFFHVMQLLIEDEDLSLADFADQASAQLLGPREAALVLIDYVVTTLKENAHLLSPASEGRETFDNMTGVFEAIIDREFDLNGCSVVLRSGQIGRVMSNPRMAKYTKPSK